ncbi:hypothetical protein H4S02_000911 [Coemansia sp. RSA 2611]|nr:hypothetical protein LPJ70_003968 [Coemansia sp. RSA 2708]KAJ2309187.1 hypothetical protein IWW54_003867 [Coemansia sp. RSA 2705]KAJ2392212.1 hypothetical protein H4S02_000911 [Coemansia sp. RSA 2611]
MSTHDEAAMAVDTEPEKRPHIDGTIKKRKPLRPSTSRADIYVTRDRRKFNSFMRRARKLLVERNYPSVTIHGLGAAIPTAIKLATALKASVGEQVTMETTTHTVTLYDDIVLQDESADISTQARQNSAVQIKMALDPAVRSKIFARKR